MKRIRTALLGLLVLCLLIVGTVTVFGKDAFLDIPRPLGTDPEWYNENPEPMYEANNDLYQKNSDSFLNKEEIMSAVQFSKGSEVTKLELMTWGEYEKQKEEGQYAIVSENRLVWVMEAEVPKYEHARFGIIHNAKVHYVYDAETGVALNSGFTGKPEEVPFPARPRD